MARSTLHHLISFHCFGEIGKENDARVSVEAPKQHGNNPEEAAKAYVDFGAEVWYRMNGFVRFDGTCSPNLRLASFPEGKIRDE